MKRPGIEVSFSWLFVLFAGIAILFLAIFIATKFIGTQQRTYQAEAGAELGAILNPLELGVESGKSYSLALPQDSVVRLNCEDAGPFGVQEVSIALKDSQHEAIPFKTIQKYVFGARELDSENISVLIMGVSLPYPVASAIIMYSSPYCLVDAPREVAQTLDGLGAREITFVTSKSTCSPGSVSVCFSEAGCDITAVYDATTDLGSVTVGRRSVNAYGSLFYAALFSDLDIYACEVMRIRKRAAHLAQVYADKTDFLSQRGCSSALGADLERYRGFLLDPAVSLATTVDYADSLKQSNDHLTCPLF